MTTIAYDATITFGNLCTLAGMAVGVLIFIWRSAANYAKINTPPPQI